MAKKTAAKKGAATRATKVSSRSTKSKTVRSAAPKAKPAAKKTTKSTAKTAAKPARKPAARPASRTTRAPADTRRVGDLPLNHRAEPSVPTATPPAPGKKVSSGLNKRDLAYFRDLLLEKRRELVGDMSSMEREALRTSGGSNLSTLPIHMADQGTDNYEQEFTLGLVEKDRLLLREINHALAKIQAGTYGICEGTGLPISRPRLEAQPWARHSIEYARQMEKRGVR